jgi:hypothetical protein
MSVEVHYLQSLRSFSREPWWLKWRARWKISPRQWKPDSKEDGMHTWWQTVVGILCEIVVADPTLGILTKGASCVLNDWNICIINLCFWYEISRFSCSALFFYFLICFLHA